MRSFQNVKCISHIIHRYLSVDSAPVMNKVQPWINNRLLCYLV